MKTYTHKGFPFFLLALLISLLPFIYFFNKYAISLPYLDDFWAVYDFMWLAKRGYENERRLMPDYVFTSNLEHIIAYTKVSSLALYYLLRDKFSLIQLLIIGNASWFLSIYVMAAAFYKKAKAPWLWLAFFPLIGISLQFSENYFWGMASHQNFSVTFFVIVAFHCLTFIQNQKLNFIVGIGFAIIAYLTSSTGVIVFYVGTIILLIQRRYYSAGFFFLTSVTCSIILFIMSKVDDSVTIDSSKVLNAFSFIGSISHLENSNILSIVYGITICLFFVYYVLQSNILKGKTLSNAELFFLSLILFVVIVGIITGLKRPNVLLSRYKHYSAIATLAVISLIYIRFYQTKKLAKSTFMVVALTLAFVYNILTTVVYSYDIRKHYEYLVTDTYNWYVNDKLTAQFQAFCDNDYYRNILKDLKITFPKNNRIDFLIKNLRDTQQIEQSVEGLAIDTSYLVEKTVAGCYMKMLSVSSVLPDNLSHDEHCYLVLSSETKDFVFSFFPERNDLPEIIATKSIYGKTLTQTVHLQYLPLGNYKLSVIRFKNQTPVKYINKKPILIKI